MTLDDLPDIEAIFKSPLTKYITFSADYCGYSGSARDLIANQIHPILLKFKVSYSKEDIPNWWEKM